MADTGSQSSPKRLTKEERRSRILEAAAHVFSERGYEAAAIDEIAERAGITKPVVYDHFSSKRELYVSLLELYTQEMFAFMGKRVLAEGSPDRRFEVGLGSFFEFVEAHPSAWRLLFRDPPPSEPTIVEAARRLQAQASMAVVTLIGSGPVADHPQDPSGFELVLEREMAAELIKTAADGLASWWYAHRDVPREHLVYVMMNALWVGFERFTAGERWRREHRAD
jgi:AcrR family transcriptional regulator